MVIKGGGCLLYLFRDPRPFLYGQRMKASKGCDVDGKFGVFENFLPQRLVLPSPSQIGSCRHLVRGAKKPALSTFILSGAEVACAERSRSAEGMKRNNQLIRANIGRLS